MTKPIAPDESMMERRHRADLESLLTMATYIAEELARIAPAAGALAAMLRIAIFTEVAMLARDLVGEPAA